MPNQTPQLELGLQPAYRWQGTVVQKLRSIYAWDVLRHIAVSPTLFLTRKDVCSKIWPDVEELAALQRLRQTLIYIKKGLPQSDLWLAVNKVSLRIDPSSVQISGLEGWEKYEDPSSRSDSWTLPFFRFTSGLDWESRRSAALGVIPAAFAAGQLEESLNELRELRRLRPDEADVDLMLAEADLCQTLYRLKEAEALLCQIPDELTPRRRAKKCLIRAHLFLRTDNIPASLPYSLEAFKGYSIFKAVTPTFRAGLCLYFCHLVLEQHSKIEKLLVALRNLIGSDPASEWQAVLTWMKASCTYPIDPIAAEYAARQLARSKMHGITAIYLARSGHDLFDLGQEKFGSACCLEAVNRLAGTDLLHHEAEAQTYLAEQHRLKGRHTEALIAFSASLRLRRGGECKVGLGTSFRGAGMSLLSLKDYEGAIDRLTEAYRAFQSINDEMSMASVILPLETCRRQMAGQTVNEELFARSLQIIQEAVKSPYQKSCLPEDLREAERFAIDKQG